MKKLTFLLPLLFTVFFAAAQKKEIDTSRVALSKAKTDTMRYIALAQLTTAYYVYEKPDSTLIFAQQAYSLAKKNNWALDQANSLSGMANVYGDMGNYVKAMSYYFQALKIAEGVNALFEVGNINNNIGATYMQQDYFKKALPHLQVAIRKISAFDSLHKSADHRENIEAIYGNITECYLHMNRVDSAEYAVKMDYDYCKKFNITYAEGGVQYRLGEVEAKKENKVGALRLFRLAIAETKRDSEPTIDIYLSTANLYYHQYKQRDSAEYYAQKSLEEAKAQKYEQGVLDAGKLLYTLYDEDHNVPQAYKYFKIATAAKDSMYSQDKITQLLSIDFNEKERQQDLQTAQKEAHTEAENRLRTYILSGGLGVLLLLAFIFWRNSNQRKRANTLLQSQNAEIEKQKKNTETTLGELRTTQAQLVQSAKMASLGELTAGIAHEIQNPLNFVNNFSEVNTELIDEMQLELDKGDYSEAKIIAGDIKANQQKINMHGKRADFIVKGMLEHSRTSTGEKMPTNINVLADEFLKLSYHGLRAKDKSFNAELITSFDPQLPQINVAHQDIGRVLLNLFNNAFYAVNQKQKTVGVDYKPEVTVATSTEKGNLIIKVKDNGNGIPDAIKDKIMQPFFTTKPTGEGTGLGLSLSYDIVVKGHGGSITVDTMEGEYTMFTVLLPG